MDGLVLSEARARLSGTDWHIRNIAEGRQEKEFDALAAADTFMAGFGYYRNGSTLSKERTALQAKLYTDTCTVKDERQ